MDLFGSLWARLGAFWGHFGVFSAFLRVFESFFGPKEKTGEWGQKFAWRPCLEEELSIDEKLRTMDL